jgi:hypothetical protein
MGAFQQGLSPSGDCRGEATNQSQHEDTIRRCEPTPISRAQGNQDERVNYQPNGCDGARDSPNELPMGSGRDSELRPQKEHEQRPHDDTKCKHRQSMSHWDGTD